MESRARVLIGRQNAAVAVIPRSEWMVGCDSSKDVMNSPKRNLLVPFEPDEVPDLVSFWRFEKSGTEFVAQQGEPYCLRSQSGLLDVVEDAAGKGGKALLLTEGQWLSIPRSECPKLDIHGREGQVTVVAWINRSRTPARHCEFIAGQWNETNRGRQYGLFLNVEVWGARDRIFGHLSNVGGPTPGYKYCMDGPMGATEVGCGQWIVAAMSYDGMNGYAWLDGMLDACPGVNPYPLAGGLHDGGANGSDFTVGAVDRSGEIGNFFSGRIAALAVYARALTPAEMFALASI
jgi:Concanavalin A-like lectin/glucanases superfamily